MAEFGKICLTFAVLHVFIVGVDLRVAKKPTKLTEANWKDMLKGHWLIEFYAPWCPACKALSPIWDKLALWSDDLEVHIAHVDVTENPGLSGRFLVTALPTIYHVRDGEFRFYRGLRTEDDIVAYIDEKQWEDVEVITWWKSPGSPHMAVLGMFFKASMHIRDMHTTITDVYGIPVWGSYTLFAVATVMIGLILGLIIVFLCDVIFPPKPHETPARYDSIHRRHARSASEDTKDNESDIVDDRQQPAQTEKRTTESEAGDVGTTARQRQPQTANVD